jgi:hypothetical protein
MILYLNVVFVVNQIKTMTLETLLIYIFEIKSKLINFYHKYFYFMFQYFNNFLKVIH